jgi:tetratricopeptide (TPR) repeat protein
MTASPNKPSRLWGELKRRNVFRSLAIYAGTAFIILEAASIIFPRWNLPDWSIDLVLWLLILGAVINIFVAWFFDLTPQGIQKTKPKEEVEESERPSSSKGWKVATYLSLVVIVALIVLNIVGGPKQLHAGDIQSLLILPFDNYTGDDQLDYVAAGMQSSLIGEMGQISALRIISKTTARAYKNLDMSLPQMAAEVNADAVVESMVMCYGDSVCVQISVVTPFPEEKQLWTAEYKVEKSQIMNLYNQVTKQIAEEVMVQLTAEEENLLAESRTINSDAYDLYLKGQYYWDQFTPEALQLALEYFNKAIEIDPEWAPPYAGVANFWVAAHQFSMAPSTVTIPNMFENLNKAFELDPHSSFVHFVSGLVNGWTTWNWGKAEEEFLKVIELSPNYALNHMYYAHILSCLRRNDEAMSHCQIALDLDPLNPMIQSLSSLVWTTVGKYEEALNACEKALSIVPNHPAALGNLVGIYAIMGDHRKSLEIWTTAMYLDGETRSSILNTYDQQGLEASALEFIAAVELLTEGDFSVDLGQLYSMAGDKEKAMYWYEMGYEARHPMLPYLPTGYYSHEPFKIEGPAFDSLLVKMNLPLAKK